jgi:hypothetical protein
MRRLRAGEDVPPALGWSGVTVRPHYGGLPLLRGWTWCGRRQGNLPDGFPQGSRAKPRGRRPVPGRTVLRPGRTSRWRAVRRCAAQACWRSSLSEQRQVHSSAPCGVPPPLMSGGEKCSHLGRSQGAARSPACGCLICKTELHLLRMLSVCIKFDTGEPCEADRMAW